MFQIDLLRRRTGAMRRGHEVVLCRDVLDDVLGDAPGHALGPTAESPQEARRGASGSVGRPRRGHPRFEPGPILVVDRQRRRQVITACCEQATAAGVRRGMALVVARALFPESAVGTLRVESAQPQRERRALRALALWAQRFAPSVATEDPDGLRLDISGCARLFHGEGALLAEVMRRCRELGFAVRAAIAPTFAGASALVRHGEDAATIVGDDLHALRAALAPLPIQALGLAVEVVAELAEVGVDRIGQLVDLPRSLLPARFGDDLLLRLDLALGGAIEVIDPVREVEHPMVERCFDGPTSQWEAIEITARRLLEELAQILLAGDNGARRVVLTLVGADRPPAVVEIVLGQPSRNASHFWALLRPKLERVELESSTGFGIDRMMVAAPAVTPFPHAQIVRWGSEEFERGIEGVRASCTPSETRPRSGDDGAAELLDLLRSRFGDDHVLSATIIESHWPERAFRLGHGAVVELRSAGGESRSGTGPGEVRAEDLRADPARRPTMLLEPPEPIDVEVAPSDGALIELRWRGRMLRIVASIGPERIAPEWWRDGRQVGRWNEESSGEPSRREPGRGVRRRDGARSIQPATRDYFMVQEERGHWQWIFREDPSGRWFLHGCW